MRQAGRDSLQIYANAGVPMGFGSDLLGEMHTFQSDELRIRAEVLGNLEALRSAMALQGAELKPVRVPAEQVSVAVQPLILDQDFEVIALPDLQRQDIIGSPYCVRRYVADQRFGGPSGLAAIPHTAVVCPPSAIMSGARVRA